MDFQGHVICEEEDGYGAAGNGSCVTGWCSGRQIFCIEFDPGFLGSFLYRVTLSWLWREHARSC